MAVAELKKMHLAPQGAFFMPIRPVGGRTFRARIVKRRAR